MAGAIRRVPAIEDARRHPDDQRPRGVHARTTSSSSARARSAGSSSPPGSAPTGSPARAASAGRWRTGSSTASPSSTSGRWTSAGSAAQYRSRRHCTLARTTENYATYYDIHYPNEERLAGRPLRLSPAYDDSRRSARSFGEKSRWERPNWFAPNEDGAGVARERSRRSGRAAGRASTGRRRSARRRWRRARPPALFDESSFAKIEVDGPGALRVPAAAVRQRRRPAGRVDHLHRRCSTAAAASSATSRSPGSRRTDS